MNDQSVDKYAKRTFVETLGLWRNAPSRLNVAVWKSRLDLLQSNNGNPRVVES